MEHNAKFSACWLYIWVQKLVPWLNSSFWDNFLATCEGFCSFFSVHQVQSKPWDRQHRRPPKLLRKGLCELKIVDVIGRRGVQDACHVIVFDGVYHDPSNIVHVDPGEPLPSVRNWTTESKPKGTNHLSYCTAISSQSQACNRRKHWVERTSVCICKHASNITCKCGHPQSRQKGPCELSGQETLFPSGFYHTLISNTKLQIAPSLRELTDAHDDRTGLRSIRQLCRRLIVSAERHHEIRGGTTRTFFRVVNGGTWWINTCNLAVRVKRWKNKTKACSSFGCFCKCSISSQKTSVRGLRKALFCFRVTHQLQRQLWKPWRDWLTALSRWPTVCSFLSCLIEAGFWIFRQICK